MPLLDHFHPPLSLERSWESLHAAWCSSLADDLSDRLPPEYWAEEHTHAGPGVEIDVATFEKEPEPVDGGPGPTAAVWTPPAPLQTVAAVFADDFEVKVISRRPGRRLVAAIELVSPRNKDRPEARRAFAVKCASYLHEGVSLIVVDVVTDRHFDLHQQIMQLIGYPDMVAGALYALAYRPVRRGAKEQIDLWSHRLAVGGALPTLPLALSGELVLPVDLEATYMTVCRRRHLVKEA